MKNLIFLSIALTIGFAACGQNVKKEDVPAVVTAKFKTLYPNVETVKWGKEDKNYEAEFILNKAETSVLFDVNGNALQTETEIAVIDLPIVVRDYVNQNCNEAAIKEASKIVDSKGVVTYEAEVNKTDYVFDKDGKFIKKVEDKD